MADFLCAINSLETLYIVSFETGVFIYFLFLYVTVQHCILEQIIICFTDQIAQSLFLRIKALHPNASNLTEILIMSIYN